MPGTTNHGSCTLQSPWHNPALDAHTNAPVNHTQHSITPSIQPILLHSPPHTSKLSLVIIPTHDIIQAEFILHFNSSILTIPRLQGFSLSQLAVSHWLHRLIAQVAHKLLESCWSECTAAQAAAQARRSHLLANQTVGLIDQAGKGPWRKLCGTCFNVAAATALWPKRRPTATELSCSAAAALP